MESFFKESKKLPDSLIVINTLYENCLCLKNSDKNLKSIKLSTLIGNCSVTEIKIRSFFSAYDKSVIHIFENQHFPINRNSENVFLTLDELKSCKCNFEKENESLTILHKLKENEN